MGLGTLVGSFLLELTADSFRLLFGGFVCFTPTLFSESSRAIFLIYFKGQDYQGENSERKWSHPDL